MYFVDLKLCVVFTFILKNGRGILKNGDTYSANNANSLCYDGFTTH